MKAIDHGAGGGLDCLHLVDVKPPRPGHGEILIHVQAAGVNRPDIFQRMGLYPPPPGASPRLGLEVAGRVAECGAGVSEWQIGDAVMALAPGGGYAEYCVVPASHALAVPQRLTFAQAAALPETWFTVWSNLVDRAHLKAGERLLIHGGASGIGLTAIQLALLRGAIPYVTVGSEKKREFCEQFGAVSAINYRSNDFATQVKALSNNVGVDVILDMVGAPYLQQNLGLLRRNGRLVYIAFLQGPRGDIDLMPVMLKRLTITGSTLRPCSQAEKAAIRDSLREHLIPAIDSGAVTPHIHATFPLAEVAEAHALMESNQHIGKIVLDLA